MVPSSLEGTTNIGLHLDHKRWTAATWSGFTRVLLSVIFDGAESSPPQEGWWGQHTLLDWISYVVGLV